MKKVPKKLQSVLWSYDISTMDLENSRELIIQQVLNYGDWNDLKWLYKTYPEKKIKEVVQNPRRGIWFENVLNFWCLMFEIKLTPSVWKRALFDLNPGFALFEDKHRSTQM